MGNTRNIVAEIVEKRRQDMETDGISFGCTIPAERQRPVNSFMAEKGVILEIKRASPSKGDIAPDLIPADVAVKYKACGAGAISCLTEKRYFKGSLEDLMAVCNAVPDVPVLRKDFLLEEEEIEVSYKCGADAVLLIAGILTEEKLLSMAGCCQKLGMRALLEVRTEEDADKALKALSSYPETIICGVNSRNLKDFTIDLLVPAMLKKKLGGKVIFESGITTAEAASAMGAMGFTGILLGEYAARNPDAADRFVKSFKETEENLHGKKLLELAEKIASHKKDKGNTPLVKICGITRSEDLLLADRLGADFTGFIFAPGFSRNVYGGRFEQMKNALKAVKAFKVAVITDCDSAEARQAASLVREGTLDFLQFHGLTYEDIPEDFLKQPHYFAISDKKSNIQESAEILAAKGESRFITDSRSHSYGSVSHLWLAGGVTPDNVEELIKAYSPELVDLSSGIEGEETGIKDEEKLKALFKIVNSMQEK